jgi:hypothetical protein
LDLEDADLFDGRTGPAFEGDLLAQDDGEKIAGDEGL